MQFLFFFFCNKFLLFLPSGAEKNHGQVEIMKFLGEDLTTKYVQANEEKRRNCRSK
jgi:hypothetical protein